MADDPKGKADIADDKTQNKIVDGAPVDRAQNEALKAKAPVVTDPVDANKPAKPGSQGQVATDPAGTKDPTKTDSNRGGNAGQPDPRPKPPIAPGQATTKQAETAGVRSGPAPRAITEKDKQYTEKKLSDARKAAEERIARQTRTTPEHLVNKDAITTQSDQILTEARLKAMHKSEIMSVASDRGYKMTISGREAMVKKFLEQQAKDTSLAKPLATAK